MILRPFLAALVAVPLSMACATPEQRADETASYINANYGPLCAKLGYTPETDAFRNCMVQMFNSDQVRMTPIYGPWGAPPAVRRR